MEDRIELNGGHMQRRHHAVGWTLHDEDEKLICIVPVENTGGAKEIGIDVLSAIQAAFKAGEAAGASTERRAITYGVKVFCRALQLD
jgi:hypothetical protein